MIKQLVLCLLVFSVVALASNAAVFMNTPWDAKTAGMGGAVSSVYGQFNTPAVNPAGLYGSQNRYASITTYRIIDADYTVLSFMSPIWFQSVLGISTVVVSSEGAKETVYDRNQHQYVQTGHEFGYQGFGGQLSFARSAFKRDTNCQQGLDIEVIAGINARWITESLAEYRSSGYGVDTGALAIIKHNGLTQRGWKQVNWGMSIQNSVQSGIQWNTASQRRSDMPKIIRTGLGLQSEKNTLLTIDMHKKQNREVNMILGGQYFLNREIPIRFGINPNQSLSFGVGVYIGALQFDVSITTPMSHDNSKQAANLDIVRLTLNVLF